MKYDYDVAVIGAGAAGLTAAGLAGSLGAKTLLVEGDRFGGDCTWTGCVPSKTLLQQAEDVQTTQRAAHEIFPDAKLGEMDFEHVMEVVRERREAIYANADAPTRIEEFGVETMEGTARFQDGHALAVALDKHTTENLTARFIIIATGASPTVPPVDGLDAVDFYTSENIFEIEDQPEHLGIIGGGPVGVELAQAFNRLGSKITMFEGHEHILPRSDRNLSQQLQAQLKSEGISVVTGEQVQRVGQKNDGGIILQTSGVGVPEVSDLLVAAGRSPNTDDINLESVGVDYGEDGIETNKSGRTSQRHIYAIGDVKNGPRFTHLSERDGKRAVLRALFKVPTFTRPVIPRVTYTKPSLAEVGKTTRQLDESGVSFDTYEFPLSKFDRAVIDNSTNGGVKVFTKSGGDTILGAAVLAPRAGELISELAVAIEHGVGLKELSHTVHPYPGYGQVISRTADQWYIHNRPTWLIRMLKKLFGYRGKIRDFSDDAVI